MSNVLKKGSKGDLVKVLQYIIGVTADGNFGSKTYNALKNYQKENNLKSDGICGSQTWKVIGQKAPVLRGGECNEYVNALEVFLQTLTDDGCYSTDEIKHIKTFQSANNLKADGIVGTKTWQKLFQSITASNSSTTVQETQSQEITFSKPVDYKQFDSKWAKVVYTQNNTYDDAQTIKSSGCGPTSMADIVATWWDKSVTPVEMCEIAVDKGYRTQNSGTSYGFFKYVAKLYNSKFIQTNSYATAESALKNGALIVCSMGPGLWTSGGHYICWWKVDDNYVYINDPGSSKAARAKSVKNNLKEQCKQYFIFYK